MPNHTHDAHRQHTYTRNNCLFFDTCTHVHRYVVHLGGGGGVGMRRGKRRGRYCVKGGREGRYVKGGGVEVL